MDTLEKYKEAYKTWLVCHKEQKALEAYLRTLEKNIKLEDLDSLRNLLTPFRYDILKRQLTTQPNLNELPWNC